MPVSLQSGIRARLGGVMVTCCLAAVLLAACSGAAATVHLPTKSAAGAAPVVKQPTLSPRQQVVAAFSGYVLALGEAEKSGSSPTARQLLSPYLAAGRIGGIVQTIAAIWAKDEGFYGVDVVHVLSVQIDGLHAFVHDCDDTSGMGLDKLTTGQPVSGSAGVPRENVITRLDRVRGHWLVEFQIIEDVPCAP
jgi:hypothetical protein